MNRLLHTLTTEQLSAITFKYRHDNLNNENNNLCGHCCPCCRPNIIHDNLNNENNAMLYLLFLLSSKYLYTTT